MNRRSLLRGLAGVVVGSLVPFKIASAFNLDTLEEPGYLVMGVDYGRGEITVSRFYRAEAIEAAIQVDNPWKFQPGTAVMIVDNAERRS